MSQAIQSSLDSLRNTRNSQYEITRPELSSWALDDQAKYSNNLHRLGLNISQLEAAKLRELNATFRREEPRLQEATAKLEQYCADDSNFLHMVRSINAGLGIVDEIVALAT